MNRGIINSVTKLHLVGYCYWGLLLLSQKPAPCPYPQPDQYSPRLHSISWRSILILLCHLHLVLPSSLFFFRFPHQNPVLRLLSHTCYMLSLSHSSSLEHSNNTWWRVQILKPLIVILLHFPVTSSLFRPKYLPQHPVLKHHQPMFLPQCERLGFAPYKITG